MRRVGYTLFLLAVFAVFSCHGEDFNGGWGPTDGSEAKNDPFKGEIPVLNSLVILPSRDDMLGGPLPLNPGFDSKITMYEADVTNASLGPYDIKATATFGEIVYNQGTQVNPLSATYITVSVKYNNLTTTYVVSFANNNFEPASLSKLTFSYGEIISPAGGFVAGDPDARNYTVRYPYGLPEIFAVGESELGGAEIIYSDTPLLLDKKQRMVVQVAAPGYNVNTYNIEFVRGTPAESFMDFIEFSAGSLGVLFDKNVTDYTLSLPRAGYFGETLYIAAHAPPGSSLTSTQGVVRPNGAWYITSPKNGSTISITVSNGYGYKPKTYKFDIIITDSVQYAYLTTLRLSPSPSDMASYNHMYPRQASERVPDKEGFEKDFLNYEYYMEIGPPATSISIVAATDIAGAEIKYYFGDEETPQTVNSPFDRSLPVQVSVSAPGYRQMTYQMYFNSPDEYKPQALLKSMNLTSGRFVDPASFLPETYNYQMSVFRGQFFMMLAAPEKDWFSVTYNLEDESGKLSTMGRTNSIENVQQNWVMKVKVDGGFAYKPTEYRATLKVTERQNPLIASLVIENKSYQVRDNIRSYEIQVTDSDQNIQVPLEWTLQQPGEVKKVEFTTDGTGWVTVPPNEDKPGLYEKQAEMKPGKGIFVMVRITCQDNTTAIYNIFLTRLEVRNDKLVLKRLLFGPVSMQVDTLPLVPEFEKVKNDYVFFTPSSEAQKAWGELDPDVLLEYPDAIVEYSNNGGLTWFPPTNVPAKPVYENQAERFLVRVSANGAHNDYSILVSRSEKLVKLVPPTDGGVIITTVNGTEGGTISYEPTALATTGVRPGSVIVLKLKPNSGYKIGTGIESDGKDPGRPKIFWGDNFASSLSDASVKGLVPTGNSEQVFRFEMPETDIKIQAFFVKMISVSNHLVGLTAEDGSGLACMDTFNTNAVMTKVTTTRNVVTLRPVLPAGSSFRVQLLNISNPVTYSETQLLSGGIDVDMSGDRVVSVLCYVVPLNRDIGDKPYYIQVTRIDLYAEFFSGYKDLDIKGSHKYELIPLYGYTDNSGNYKTESTGGWVTPDNWFAPAKGYYKFEVWGAAGGDGAADSGYPHGKGGYSVGYFTNAINEQEMFSVYVGGKGGENGDRLSGVGSSRTEGVPAAGANGGGQGGASWNYFAGGSGGGRTNINNESGEAIIIAGGGGGGGTDDASYGKSQGTGGDGGGGNGAYAAGGVQTSISDGNSSGRGGAGDFGSTQSGAGGGGGGYYGGKGGGDTLKQGGGAGGSAFVDTRYFNGIDGTRGTNDGWGKAKITWLGVRLSN